MPTTRPGTEVGEALVAQLVDDAGLFPPTALPMPDAVTRHRDDAAVGDPMLSHCFLCPASRLGELAEHLDAADRFEVGLIADTGPAELPPVLAAVEAEPRLALRHIEAPLAAAGDDPTEAAAALLAATPTGVPLYLEPGRWADVDELISVLVRARLKRDLRLKVRCGGVTAELFPSPEELAHAIVASAAANVPFKATAGLHEAVRHTDQQTGFTHHGYVNLLTATASCLSAGAHASAGERDEESAVARVLRDQDRASLVRRLAALDIAEAVAVRRVFSGYGSCSTRMPLTDARDLGLRTEDV
jgi:hypothetical protein